MLDEAPRIWARRPNIIEPRDPIGITLGVAGEYRLRVYRPDGRCRVDTGFFPNLITNTGLNNPGVGTAFNAISVGTGNAVPAFIDTQLQNRIATSTTNEGSFYTGSVGTPGDPNWYTAYTLIRRFAQGVAAGNLTEIGVTTASSPWTCYSRALIVDGSGNPTTLTILSDEILDATYRHRWYAGPDIIDDIETTINISGTDHDIVLRRSEVDGTTNQWRPSWGGTFTVTTAFNAAYNGSIGDIASSPSGESSGPSSVSNSAYVTDSFQRQHSVTWGLSQGNLAGGISAVKVGISGGRVSAVDSTSASYQFSVDPVIAKNSSQILTLNYLSSWARRSL